jgi:hypothetical protein
MRVLAVAILATGNGFMFVLMTLGTFKLTVLELASLEGVVGLIMTGSTVLGWSLCRVGNLKGHMRLVAGEADLKVHTIYMGRVTVETVGHHGMTLTVTGRTGYLGMGTLVLLELGHLVGMTGKTRIGQIFVNGDNLGGMRVVMAVEAAL